MDVAKCIMSLPDEGVDHGLAATPGELQGRVGAVPLVEHEGHLCCNGAICWQPRQQEAKQVQPVQHKRICDLSVCDLHNKQCGCSGAGWSSVNIRTEYLHAELRHTQSPGMSVLCPGLWAEMMRHKIAVT